MNTRKLFIAAAAVLLAGTSMASAQTVLRYSDYGPNRGARAEAMEWFADELEKRSDGALSIEFFWGGTLVGGRDTLNGVASGVADMGTIVGFFTPAELQAYNMADLPVDNSDMWIGMRAIYDLVNENAIMREEFSDAGVRYVTNFTTGPVQMICNMPVESIDDISGKKVRASGPYGDTLTLLGAEVSRMSQADVYQALDSGLIDCNQNYYYAMEAYRQYEVAQHVLAMDWGQNMSFGIVINPNSYDRLSDEEKAVFDEVSSDFIDRMAEVMTERSEKAKQAMIEGAEGPAVTLHQLSEEDRARLNEASRKSIEAWAEKAEANGIDSARLLSDYEALIEKYRGIYESEGYPWSN